MKIKIICLSCKTELKYRSTIFGKIKCNNCESEYQVINDIPIMLDSENDFYRYMRIFTRLVDLKL